MIDEYTHPLPGHYNIAARLRLPCVHPELALAANDEDLL
jgi:hypothetical protein